MFNFTNLNLYSFFLGLGFFLGLAYFFFFLWRKKFPGLGKLFFLSCAVFPFALLGARLWTYLFSDLLREAIDNLPTTKLQLERFFGLDPNKGWDGLSAHGAIIAAAIYFFFLFFWYGNKYRVSSVYCFDILIRAALIMQIVGRWGNFFNQELLGDIISDNYPQEYGWIPEWFGKKLHLAHLETTETIRHPLFFYESLGNFLLFFLIVFLLPKIVFLGNYFRIFHSPLFRKKNSKYFSSLSVSSCWKRIKLFFHYFYLAHQFYQKQIYDLAPKSKKIPYVVISQKQIWQHNYFPQFSSTNYLKIQAKIILHTNSFGKRKLLLFYLWLRRDCQDLTNFFNPSNFFFLRLGTGMSFYLLGYGILRLILQPLRELNLANHSMDITNVVSYLFLSLGVVSFLLFQWIIPYKWRQKGYLYESWYL